MRRSPAVTTGLLVHAVVVVAFTVLFFFLYGLGDPDGGANIGAGIALLPLLGLGLPWSLLVVVERLAVDAVAPPGELPSWALTLDLFVTLVPAYVNVLLHLMLNRRRAARAART